MTESPPNGPDETQAENTNQEILDELMEKDAKSGRQLKQFWYVFTSILGVFMVMFYMYNSGVMPVATQYHRGLYILVTFVMVFLSYPMTKKSRLDRPSISDLVLALISIAVVGYWIMEYENLNYRMGSETDLDTAVAIVGILISLEAARRVLGMSMTMAGIGFLAYLLWGNLLHSVPVLGSFAHDGFRFTRALNFLFYNQDGVFGIMANVLVTYVILFIFFGSFLKASGASRFFIDLPLALAGKSVGGPAKVAVIASGFFGSVSGSAIANTVSTGAFTIPMMKKAGFRPHVAGAIEPSASIGGMFMPPIMGAGGFLMAEMTEIPYVQIMKMAIFPASMYFLSVFVMIHFEAKRHGLYGIDDPNAPSAWDILKKEWFLAAPLILIVVMMLLGYSAGFAAVAAILSCIVVSWFTPDHKMGWRQIMDAMIEGSRNTLIIGATVGVIGIIVGTISLSGIGLKFSDIIISLSGGFLPVAILLIGIASLVLGMGVPVTAAYLITAVLTVGSVSNMIAVQQFGMPLAEMELSKELYMHAPWVLISSHMIVYWFSQDSNITPPVCVAAYAGAAIAGSDPWKTGWTSFKFAKFLYIGPFLFAYSRGFLLSGSTLDIAMAFLTITLATIAFGSLTMGYLACGMNPLEWVIMAFATTILFFPGLVHWAFHVDIPGLLVDCIGILLWAAVYLMQKGRIRNNPNLTLSIHEQKKLLTG
ncbi:MAG: TRAP transporter fused permease subunit [Gemmatimonadales bacterium]|nr:TRAP transporter fused permease subunit [Gemmatimonadales bacterium]